MPKVTVPTGKDARYMGIDPGASGCIAILHSSGAILAYHDMDSESKKDTWDFIHSQGMFVSFAVIEQVGNYMGTRNNAVSMFKFGNSYGNLEGWLIAAGIPFERIIPRTWQKGVGIVSRDSKKETPGQFKGRLKSRAQELFPSTKMTLSNCDACLIAEFCRRKREGQLSKL